MGSPHPRGALSVLMAALRALLEAEKHEAVPLRARHMPRDRAQRFVDALLIAETFFQHLYLYALALELAGEPGAWYGQAWIADIKSPLSCRLGQLSYKGLRRPNPQFGVLGQCQGPLAGALRQVALSVGLQTPSDTPHQELFVI